MSHKSPDMSHKSPGMSHKSLGMSIVSLDITNHYLVARPSICVSLRQTTSLCLSSAVLTPCAHTRLGHPRTTSTHHIRIDYYLEQRHGWPFFEPRRAGNEGVQHDDETPKVQQLGSHGQLGCLVQRNQLRGYLIVWSCTFCNGGGCDN